MILYSRYGTIQGTVDEILEFISKQRINIQNYGTNDVNKIFVDMGATSNAFFNKEEIIKNEEYLNSKTKPEDFNDLEKLSWQYSKVIFAYAEQQKGSELTLDEMNEVAKQLVEEQNNIIKKYNNGESFKEIDLSSYIRKGE